VDPGTDNVKTFAVEYVFRVVQYTNGIVNVEKLKIVLDTFDVNPAHTIFVVTTAFEA
jgi:hypothetical protein